MGRERFSLALCADCVKAMRKDRETVDTLTGYVLADMACDRCKLQASLAACSATADLRPAVVRERERAGLALLKRLGRNRRRRP